VAVTTNDSARASRHSGRVRPLLALSLALVACGRDDAATTDADTTATAAGPGATTTSGSAGAPPTPTSSSTADTRGEDDTSTGAPLEGYDDPGLWLCHPDRPEGEDACRSADLTATELLPDGGTEVLEHVAATDPPFDCFYVYPTVDLRLAPGQTEDFADLDQELDPLLNQAARFTSMCRMFAPLYHQVTIGTFGSDQAATLLAAVAVEVAGERVLHVDVRGGERPFVILGHSQGTFMTQRLLREVVEPDPALRERLLAAVLLGGSFSVPQGEAVGGSLAQIPVCEAREQVGCVLAYRTYAADRPPGAGVLVPEVPGGDHACTNPAGPGDAPARSAGAYFATFTHQPLVFLPLEFAVDTPFVRMRDYYTLTCATNVDGVHYLAVAADPAEGDVREDPVDFDDPLLSPDFLGLHVFDYNFALQDLLDVVAAKAAAAGL
jgi:hypothetical protein